MTYLEEKLKELVLANGEIFRLRLNTIIESTGWYVDSYGDVRSLDTPGYLKGEYSKVSSSVGEVVKSTILAEPPFHVSTVATAKQKRAGAYPQGSAISGPGAMMVQSIYGTALALVEQMATESVETPVAPPPEPVVPATGSVDLSGVKELIDGMKSVLAADFLKLVEQVKFLTNEVAQLRSAQPENGCHNCPMCAGGAQPSVNVEPIVSKVDLVLEKIEAEEERRELAKIAREAKEAADKASKIARVAEEQKKAVVAKEKKAALKEERKAVALAKKERAKEIVAAKQRGEDPYTPQETEKYKARLEKKGKTFYSVSERAAHKLTLASKDKDDGARLKAGGKKFRHYSAVEKAAFIKANFTDKGRVYYSKEQRAAFKASLAK